MRSAWCASPPSAESSQRPQPELLPAADVILYAACHLTHENPHPAAFSAGAVFTSVPPEPKAAFGSLGESLAGLSTFAALLVFGALLTSYLFAGLPAGGYVAVVLATVRCDASDDGPRPLPAARTQET